MAKVITIQLFKNIKTLVKQNKQQLYNLINTTLTETYLHIGSLIVAHKQQDNTSGLYAQETLLNSSAKLTTLFYQGFWVNDLENMRKFYIVYKDDYVKYVLTNQKSVTVSRELNVTTCKLSWPHCILQNDIENPTERKFFEIESVAENCNSRVLKRQYDSALYERLAPSRNKSKVRELGKKGGLYINVLINHMDKNRTLKCAC